MTRAAVLSLMCSLLLSPRGSLAQTAKTTIPPGTSQCSASVILGSSTDYDVLGAGSSLNSFGADIVVARPDSCTKLSRSSGSLRCSPSTLQYTDPQTGLLMTYIGIAGTEIPIGAATSYGGACSPTPSATPSASQTPTPTPSVTPTGTPLPPGSNWVARGPIQYWNCVAMTRDGSKMLAGTVAPQGTAGSGQVFMSTDGGVTWALTLDTSTFGVSTTSGNGCIWVSLSDSGAVLAASCNNANTLYVSRDGGSSWTTSYNCNGASCMGAGLSGDGTTIYTGYHYAAKSTNSGASWSTFPAYSGNENWNWCTSSNGQVVAYFEGQPSQNNHIVISTNGGSTWSLYSNVMGGQNNGVPAMSSSGTTIALTQGYGARPDLYVSTNTGQTWSVVLSNVCAGGSAPTMSSDGTKMHAWASTTPSGTCSLYFSGNTGVSWTAVLTSSSSISTPFPSYGYGNFWASNGARLVAAQGHGPLYVSG